MATVFDLLFINTTGDIHIWKLPNIRGQGAERWTGTRKLSRFEHLVKKYDQLGYGVFFCVSTIAEGKPRKKEFAVELPWLFQDIDFKDHDETQDQILAILLALPCPPSRIHHTGGGLHLFWYMDRPFLNDVQGAPSMELAEELLKKLCAALGGDPMVTHRVALLRVPGTTNSKREPGSVVRVLKEGQERYAVAQIEAWLGSIRDPVLVRRGQESNAFTQHGQNSGRTFKPPVDVVQRLKDMRYRGVGEASVNATYCSVTGSLMRAGVEIDEIVEYVLAATKELDGTDGWNWIIEERKIRRLCTDAIENFKLEERRPNGLSADAVVSLKDALKSSKDKAERPILDALDPMRSARAMYGSNYVTADGHDVLVRHRGEFFQWDGTCYQIVSQEAQRGEIWRYLENARILTKDGKPAPFRPKKENIGNIYEALGAICAVDDRVEPPAWIGDETPIAPPREFFAASNGLLHLPTRTLHAPTPSYFGVTASSVAYDADAAQPTKWLAFLQETVADDEAIGALQEWMGYTLGGDTSQQKIAFCIGPRRSGKGTKARVHTALLGKNSVGGPTMTSFGTQFGLAPLITKSLAIVSDARIGKKTDRAAITERLLTISGEDTISIDRKYNPVMWTGQLPTRITILTNELPAFSEGSGALAGRFLVILFQHSFYGREDPGLTDRLMKELPGILNWAIEGYERLQERGHFVQPRNALEQIEAIERLGNPVKAFVLDRCVVGPAQEIGTDVLFEDWRVWCTNQGADPGNKDWFGRNLRSAVPGLTTARPEVDGHRVTVYRGVGIETPLNPMETAGHRLTQRARGRGPGQ